MLLRFGVANHRSIYGYQELLLSASKATQDTGLVMPVPTLRESAVPVVAIYGANAAGKSNLIDAMYAIRRYVVGSHTGLAATDTIPRDPFALNGDAGPTRLDCTFRVDGRNAHYRSNGEDVYEYGFEYSGEAFRREWLYRMVRNERLSTQTLFERETEGGTVRVNFGGQLRGENRTIANLTRPNSLFLSASAQNNHPQLTALYTHFAKDWNVVLTEQTLSGPNAAERLWNFVRFDRLVELVRQADIGIDGIGVGEEEVVDEGKRLYFLHSGADGRQAVLDYDMQSKGTRTLITLLIPALEALAAGSLLVVDELDPSLHPDLARAFVSLFSNPESNPHGAQLIFSTHDVTLLNSGLLRRDEIWMADKDRQGASRFVPLSDFNLRSRDDIERAYRNGRVGGVPLGNEFHIDLDDSSRSVDR
ncbi:MAG: ATP-binding protein [Gammaproteobacteria bacterium]|nr:ATP-binding protein [Gammaproteobacteria bacterium]